MKKQTYVRSDLMNVAIIGHKFAVVICESFEEFIQKT